MMKLSRRRFLGHVLGAGLVSAAAYGTYRGFVPGYPKIHLDYPGMDLGHAMRDALIKRPVNIPSTDVNVLIAGSGGAGLSAAWALSKQGMHDYVVLDGPERNGNNRGETNHNVSYPTGAHYLPLPAAESTHIQTLLGDLGIYQNGRYDESAMVNAPSERLYYHNKWQPEIIPDHDADSERFFRHMHTLSAQRGSDDKRLFVMPITLSSMDATWRALDQITFATWLQQQNYQSESLLWYCDYCCRDDYGQGIHQVSAWAGLHYFCARNSDGKDGHTVLTWPQGLNELSERMRRYCKLQNHANVHTYRPLVHTPTSLAASALSIEEHAQGVRVLCRDGKGNLRYLNAQKVICAMPLYIAARVVNNIQQYGFEPQQHLPEYAPWLVSNFILKGFPTEKSGAPLAWDNVAYQGQGLGFVLATHQEIWRSPPPYTSFTAYNALNHDSPQAIRHWLVNSSPEAIYQHAAAEIEHMYGLQLRRHMVEARITVRGHAMAAPTPQYLNNTGLQALQNHTGRLCFAHSDLSGYSVFEEACWWGQAAAEKIMRLT